MLITGVSNPYILRAAISKPWRDSIE